jgi:DNA repair protein RadC
MGEERAAFPSIIREAAMPLPDEDPLYRLATHGEATLSDAELVAIICDVRLEEARVLLFGGLRTARSRDHRFLPAKGAARRRRAKLAAAFELGRRAANLTESAAAPITNQEDIAHVLLAQYSHASQEELGAVYVDAKNRPMRVVPAIFRGTVNSALVATRDILRIALDLNAAGLIAFHHHPSGCPDPSGEDIAFTRKLHDACKAMNVELLDHLVLGANRCVSFKQRGWL